MNPAPVAEQAGRFTSSNQERRGLGLEGHVPLVQVMSSGARKNVGISGRGVADKESSVPNSDWTAREHATEFWSAARHRLEGRTRRTALSHLSQGLVGSGLILEIVKYDGAPRSASLSGNPSAMPRELPVIKACLPDE